MVNPKKAIKSILVRGTSTGSRRSTKIDHPIEEELFPPQDSNFDDEGHERNESGDAMDASMMRVERVQRMYAEQKSKERDELRQQYLSRKKEKRKKQEKMLTPSKIR